MAELLQLTCKSRDGCERSTIVGSEYCYRHSSHRQRVTSKERIMAQPNAEVKRYAAYQARCTEREQARSDLINLLAKAEKDVTARIRKWFL